MAIQKKYHIFDEEYYKKINTVHQDRLKKFGPNLTVSFSQTDEDGNPLFCSNNYFSDIKEGLITKKSIEGKKSLNDIDFILDNFIENPAHWNCGSVRGNYCARVVTRVLCKVRASGSIMLIGKWVTYRELGDISGIGCVG